MTTDWQDEANAIVTAGMGPLDEAALTKLTEHCLEKFQEAAAVSAGYMDSIKELCAGLKTTLDTLRELVVFFDTNPDLKLDFDRLQRIQRHAIVRARRVTLRRMSIWERGAVFGRLRMARKM